MVVAQRLLLVSLLAGAAGLGACDSSTKRDQSYGSDAGSGFVPPPSYMPMADGGTTAGDGGAATKPDAATVVADAAADTGAAATTDTSSGDGAVD